MENRKLAGLQPEAVFKYFEEMCAIPHGSGNTKAISDYLVDFAKAHGLRYIQDEANNVILFGDATPGYEDHAPVILQGHMDMVCEKDEDCPINMDTDGLDVTHDGKYVFARGTTLGGDNGIAVAYALAILADPTVPHPALEVIVTVDEEIGMLGADVIDLTMLKGRTLLNLDSEEEGIFTVACAGGATATITLPTARCPVYGPCIRLSVEGLQGGHSGVEIQKNRANAIKVMGELLRRVEKEMPLCITSLQGGAKDNAIPRSCQVTAVMLGMHPERINEIAEKLQAEIRSTYDEPEAVISGENVEALGGNALSQELTGKVIALMNRIPTGVAKMSADIEGLVQTSQNIGILRLEEGLKVTVSVRSSVNGEKLQALQALRDIAAEFEAEYEEMGDYPAWEYKEDSQLRRVMVQTYRDMFHGEPEIVAIHAGLECGLLSEKLPGLDCVSIGPEMHDIHTSRERLGIESTARTYAFVLEILKNL